MKERPIIFNDDMVRAVLSGQKTQTRRLVNPQPESVHSGEPYWHIGGYRAWLHRDVTDPLRMGTQNPLICQFGKIGDRLWVRHTWQEVERASGKGFAYRAAYKPDEVPLIKWRPSIHMPRSAAVIFLEIIGVRVERLNQISEADAVARSEKLTRGLGND